MTQREVCRTKTQYSKRDAQRQVNRLFKEPLAIYHCPACNFWHLTSKVKKKRKGGSHKPEPRRLKRDQEIE